MPVVTCPDCGARIGGIREVQRVDRKGALQTWETLTPTAQEVLRLLYRFRLASHWQVGDAIYLDSNAANRKNRAKNQLVRLQKLGLVQRLDGEKKHHGMAFYSLTDEGIFCCQAEQKAGGKHVKKVKSLKARELLDSPAWKHHRYLTDVMASFAAAEKAGLGELLDCHGDGQVTYHYKSVGGKKSLRPDSTILWSDGHDTYLCWLELEHKHATLDEFVEKIKKYVQFSRAGSQPGDAYKVATGQNEFPVLLVVAVKGSQFDANRQGQLGGLRKSILRGVLQGAGGEGLPDISRRIVVGLTGLEDIKHEGVLSEVWEPVLQRGGTLVGFEGLFRLL